MAGNPGTTVLLTRPEAQSADYARRLTAAFGDRVQPLIAPLLEIRDLPLTAPLDGVGLVLFSSRNGVHAFVRQSGWRGAPALCVGVSTAAAARQAGFAAQSAGGTAADLIAAARRHPAARGGTCLHLRGKVSRGDVAATLRGAGLDAHQAVVYEQIACALPQPVLARLESGARAIVPLFSPRTAEIFAACVAERPLKAVTAVAISENAARPLAGLSLDAVEVAAEPTADAVTRIIAAIL